jgi:hypothetical protein
VAQLGQERVGIAPAHAGLRSPSGLAWMEAA